MSDGLEDVVAAHTVLSEVDGAAGRLVIRGHSLDELAGHTSFEEMAALLFELFGIDDQAPTRRSHDAGSTALDASRSVDRNGARRRSRVGRSP